jgi:hypothetical protein
MKRVPHSFKVLGHTVEVVTIPLKKWKHGDAWAFWDSDKLRIEVCSGKRSMAFHSFCHELSHCLFEMAGRGDLSSDEALVDTVGGLLAQALSSAE